MLRQTVGVDVALRARNADLLIFAANGFLFATWMGRLPDIRNEMQLTPSQLGLLLLALSAGAISGLPTAGRLLERIGSTRVVRLGLTLALPGVVLAAVAAHYDWMLQIAMIGMFFAGFGTGIWDVAQNLEGTVIEQALGRSVMPWFHAAFSGGTVVGAVSAVLFIRLGIAPLPHVLLIVLLCFIAVLIASSRFLPALGEHHESSQGGSVSPWRESRTLLVGLMVLATGLTEGTANDWMAIAFIDGHGVSNAIGVVALAVFLSAMTLGRVLGTSILDRFGRVPVLRVLFASSLVGSSMVIFGSTAVAFVGAAIWGVGASLGFPVGMSAAADDPKRAAARLSVVSTIGYAAFLAGPALIGFLGDRVGVLRALLVVCAAAAMAFLVVPAARPLEQ